MKYQMIVTAVPPTAGSYPNIRSSAALRGLFDPVVSLLNEMGPPAARKNSTR
jgi:hypothetical protein